jgi:hypothetical protein
VVSRPLWQIRLVRGLPRYVLYATCAAGLVASARFAIAPPRAPGSPSPAAPLADEVAPRAFACQFARRYLTWSASEPVASERALEAFAGAGVEPDFGIRLPPAGEQRVEWAEVVQERQPLPAEHVYTVAAQTDASGLVYLAVSVLRGPDGSLALAGYPAFVGTPASGPAQAAGASREVTDGHLATVIERALRNYLAGSESNLAADLAGGARVSLPAQPLSVESMARPRWAPGGGSSVLAVVQAQDARGVHYALEYEMDVVRADGRWEVAALQMDPRE